MKGHPPPGDAGAARQATAGAGAARRLAWFVGVGCAAASVHWSVAVALVSHGGWHPLRANVAGWMAAVGLSFIGHHRATFRGHGAPVARSALRFGLISGGGFALNEAAYALLLQWDGRHYGLLLGLVLTAVAALTYGLSRHWAFLRSEADPS